MTIAFSTVTIDNDSITLRNSANFNITLSSNPNGIVYGTVMANGIPVVVEQISTKKYKAAVWGGRVGRMLNGVVKVILTDDDGPVQYGTPITLTIAETTEPFVVQPQTWVKDLLDTYWDETFMSKPLIILPSERKANGAWDLKGMVEIVVDKVETEVKGRGDYKTNRYPIEIITRSEGKEDSEDRARNLLAECKRIIESYWNNISYLGLDFVEFLDDDGHDMSAKMAGKYEWRWNFKIVGPYRGRVGTPETPNIGEDVYYVNSVPAAADAQTGILYYVVGASGTRDRLYMKLKSDSDTYSMVEIADGGA